MSPHAGVGARRNCSFRASAGGGILARRVTYSPHDAGKRPARGGHDVIVMGASAGGVEAVLKVAGGLSEALPAVVLVVIHTSPASPWMMGKLLSGAGPMPAGYAVDGEEARAGRIY